MEFSVLRLMGQVKNKVRILNFTKPSFQLFKDSVNKTLWETALGTRQQKRAGITLRMFFIEWKSP